MNANTLATSEFFLFIAGDSPRSLRAVESLDALQSRLEESPVKVSVVDVFKNPPLADEYKVLATPTLIRATPSPSIRLIGDFSDVDKLAHYLNLKPSSSAGTSDEMQQEK